MTSQIEQLNALNKMEREVGRSEGRLEICQFLQGKVSAEIILSALDYFEHEKIMDKHK